MGFGSQQDSTTRPNVFQVKPDQIPLACREDGSAALEDRHCAGETKQMTVHVGVVDLGQVDLLVPGGFHSSRSDLIRTALRIRFALLACRVTQNQARRCLTVGLQHKNRADPESAVAASQRLRVQIVGLACIAYDRKPDWRSSRSNP
jgi:Arc/MetJ-type ribon-helix-helix transcriptional regulator